MSADAQLRAIQQLLRDMSFECEMETHTLDGKPLIAVDEEGKKVERGGGYFAWPDGTRLGDHEKNWPKGHRAKPCGRCWGCRIVILGCGYLSVYDGRGPLGMRYRGGHWVVVRERHE